MTRLEFHFNKRVDTLDIDVDNLVTAGKVAKKLREAINRYAEGDECKFVKFYGVSNG